MTSKKKSKKPSAAATRWGCVGAVWLIAFGVVVFGIERSEFPAQVASNTAVKAVYHWRDGALAAYDDWQKPLKKLNPETIEPAAGENAGYKDDDRKELDSLISRGPYNQ